MEKNVSEVSNLNNKQMINYVKEIIFDNNINEALDTLLKNEKKDLNITKTIIDVLDDELVINKIKEECSLEDKKSIKLFVYSNVIAILSFYNKSVILNNLFKNLSEEEKRDIAIYEYKNKTNVSLNSKIFDKYCFKYKGEAEEESNPDKTEVLLLDEEIEKYNNLSDKKIKNKSNLIPILVSLLVIIILGVAGYKIYDYNKLISKYKGLFYPGIYLNDIDLTGRKVSDLKNIIDEEKTRIQNGTLIVNNVNGDYKFTYEELGILVEDNKIEDNLTNYNNNLSFFKKISMIKGNKRNKTFYMKATYDDKVINNLMKTLEEKLNTTTKNDGIVVDDNHNVYYDKGTNGFTLDVSKTEVKIEEALENLTEETKAQASGHVVKNEIKYESLSSINKKVSTHTTYFANAGNRGHNINLASSRLNNTILMPGETFSYLKVVGPYGASNGYLPAPIYLNGDTATANGGGVCQLASTLYMAQLKAGLQTVSRRGHTFAPTYVPKGLDATVYSTTTDFKFKNNYEYPVYIVSYVKGNYLTVDIWTNENALGGKTYEPYSVASNGGWLAYLKIIEDGKVIETKYLDRSVYKAH